MFCGSKRLIPPFRYQVVVLIPRFFRHSFIDNLEKGRLPLLKDAGWQILNLLALQTLFESVDNELRCSQLQYFQPLSVTELRVPV